MNTSGTFLIMAVALLAPHLNETDAKMNSIVCLFFAGVFYIIDFIIEAMK